MPPETTTPATIPPNGVSGAASPAPSAAKRKPSPKRQAQARRKAERAASVDPRAVGAIVPLEAGEQAMVAVFRAAIGTINQRLGEAREQFVRQQQAYDALEASVLLELRDAHKQYQAAVKAAAESHGLVVDGESWRFPPETNTFERTV